MVRQFMVIGDPSTAMSEIGSANRHSAQNGEFPTQWREQRLVGSLRNTIRDGRARRTAGSVTQSGGGGLAFL